MREPHVTVFWMRTDDVIDRVNRDRRDFRASTMQLKCDRTFSKCRRLGILGLFKRMKRPVLVFYGD